jgi:protein-S-isoprenylcysteine O-methyltransferase Ste14
MKTKEGEHPFGDTGQLIALGAFFVVWIADSFVFRWSTFLSKYVPLHIRLVVLALALVMAISLVKSAHAVVSREERPDHVVTTGAFRYVRHPLYLGSILTYLGLAISTASLLSLLLLAAIFVFHDYIASYEEKLLITKFGSVYEEYRKRTGKWVPRIA